MPPKGATEKEQNLYQQLNTIFAPKTTTTTVYWIEYTKFKFILYFEVLYQMNMIISVFNIILCYIYV